MAGELAERGQSELAFARDTLSRLERGDEVHVLETVNELLTHVSNVELESNLLSQVHPEPVSELGVLLESKQRDDPSARAMGLWESLYHQQRVRAERYAFDARAVRPYFEFDAVHQAILDLNSELFEPSVARVSDARDWHPSVHTFDAAMDGEPIGKISLDMHPRPGKFTHAACFHLRSGVGGRQTPHVVLVCNVPDSTTRSAPALLEHNQVVTFFHEFGHLVHGLARGRVPWIRLSSPSERDFMEAPVTVSGGVDLRFHGCASIRSPRGNAPADPGGAGQQSEGCARLRPRSVRAVAPLPLDGLA